MHVYLDIVLVSRYICIYSKKNLNKTELVNLRRRSVPDKIVQIDLVNVIGGYPIVDIRKTFTMFQNKCRDLIVICVYLYVNVFRYVPM
jgi:hypothetical protein